MTEERAHRHAGGMPTQDDYLEILIAGVVRNLETKIQGVVAVADERDRRITDAFRSSDQNVKTALDAQKEQVAAALLSSEKAVNKAEAAQGEKNAAQNEFRGQLRDQADTLYPRSEAQQALNGLDVRATENRHDIAILSEKLQELRVRQAVEDRTSDTHQRSTSMIFATIIGSLGLVIAISSIIISFVH